MSFLQTSDSKVLVWFMSLFVSLNCLFVFSTFCLFPLFDDVKLFAFYVIIEQGLLLLKTWLLVLNVPFMPPPGILDGALVDRN